MASTSGDCATATHSPHPLATPSQWRSLALPSPRCHRSRFRCHTRQGERVSIHAKTPHPAALHPSRAPGRRGDHRPRGACDAEDASSAHVGRKQKAFCHGNRLFGHPYIRMGTTPTDAAAMRTRQMILILKCQNSPKRPHSHI